MHLAPEVGYTQGHVVLDPAHALLSKAQPLNVFEV